MNDNLTNDYYYGSCLCKKVKFKARNFMSPLGHCHCVDCRKFHGAAFSTFVEMPLEDFEWLQGESAVSSFTAENNSVRQFCSHCGSSISFTASRAKDKTIEIALALFETPPDVKPDAHIFTDCQVPWAKINDGLPRFKRHRY